MHHRRTGVRFPPSPPEGGSAELSLSSVGSHFPRSVSAVKRFVQIFKLDGLCTVVVVRGDDDLVAPDEDLVHEVLEELVAGLDSSTGRPSTPSNTKSPKRARLSVPCPSGCNESLTVWDLGISHQAVYTVLAGRGRYAAVKSSSAPGSSRRAVLQSENASVETNSLIFVAISAIVSSAVSSPLRDARRGLSSRRSS